jgi:HEAT repeat protein
MKRSVILGGLAAVLLLAVVLVYGAGWFFHAKPPVADDLEKTALADGSPLEQQKAAADLIALGRPALPNIRRVLHESTSPEVRAIMIMGIAQTQDMESVEDVFKALDDDAYVVRVQALAAMRRLLFFDRIFKPEAPHEERVAAIKKLRQQMADNKKEAERQIQAGKGNTREKGQPQAP